MPTRYLKPGVRDSESIDSLSPHSEILYYRLLVTVDDFGRYDARPSMVKAACFPIKDAITAVKTDALLRELVENGLIVVYEVDSKPFLQMCKWDNIPRAKESKYPPHLNNCTQTYADVCNANTYAPLTETKTKTETKTVEAPEGVSQEVWDSFVKQRKAKKAQVTQLVIDGIGKEAAKAGWTLEAALQEIVVRNWQSFKAEWVADKSSPADKRQNHMAQLTRGMSTPKPQPFWAQPATVIEEIPNVEPKRLL